jgi:hypothetical protein
LAAIYKTIGFYLDNRAAVDAYAAAVEGTTRDQRAAALLSPNVAELQRRMEALHTTKTT